MPWKAWRRALICTVAGTTPLFLLVRAGARASPPGRWLAAGGIVVLVGLATFLSWIYLPDVDWPGRTLRRLRRGTGRIAITFDDGPNGEHTESVLAVLRKHGARATFFLVGEAARKYPQLVARIAREGHVVGNHTFEHALLPWRSRAEVERQVRLTQDAIEAAGAPRPKLFRAPKGFKSRHLRRVLARESLRLCGWTRGVWDTDRPGVDVIVRRALASLSDGTILLLHDGLPGRDRSQTAAALDRILAECRRRGLEPVSLPELQER